MNQDHKTDIATIENERTKSWVSNAFSISLGKFSNVAKPFEANVVHQSTEIGVATVAQTVHGAFGDRRIRKLVTPRAAFHFVQNGTQSKGIYQHSSQPICFRFSDDYLASFREHHKVTCALDEPLAAMRLLRNADLHIALAKDFLNSDGFGGLLRAEALLTLILSDTVATMQASQQPGTQKGLSLEQVAKITDYIDTHLDHALNLEKLAALVHVSPFHFARVFKQTTGLSPHQFVIKHRIEKAKDLLENTNISIASIALDVGFSSQSHFSTAFKKSAGVPPKAFRTIRSC